MLRSLLTNGKTNIECERNNIDPTLFTVPNVWVNRVNPNQPDLKAVRHKRSKAEEEIKSRI